MKIKNRLLSAFVIVFLFSGMSVMAQDNEDWNSNKRAELIEDAEESRSIFKDKNDELEDMFQEAYGYAIFPNVGSGAYILGGAAGNGVVFEQGDLVGFAELRQIDIGLQIGGQAFRQVILFKNKAALDEFKTGDFEIGGNISAVVIEQGEARSIRFQDGIAVATMPKAGAMVELSVGGQKFEYADDWENK